MKKILVIIKREYLVRVRTRAFLLGTLGSPLLLLAITLLPSFLASRGGGERSVTVLDQSGDPGLFAAVQERLKAEAQEADSSNSGRPRRGETHFTLSQVVVPPGNDIDEFRKSFNGQVEADSSKAYVVLKPGVLEGDQPEYYAKSVTDFAIRDLERAISAAITQRKLVRAGFDPGRVVDYTKPVEMATIRVGPAGESRESGFQVFQVGFVMLFFIYVTVLVYGITVMRGVIEEKQSRIVEVVISSVRPVQMMLGKIVGIGMVALTQYLVWVLLAVLLILFGTTLFATTGVEIPNIPTSLLVYFVLFFVLGYFLYATLYAMVGAMVSSEEEGQQVQFPITMLIITPMVLFTMVLNNPNGPTAVGLSLVPFFAPTLMMMRIAVASPPLWQIVLSMVIMVVSILAAAWVAARIYRVGILMYGKRPSIAELGRWLRYTT